VNGIMGRRIPLKRLKVFVFVIEGSEDWGKRVQEVTDLSTSIGVEIGPCVGT